MCAGLTTRRGLQEVCSFRWEVSTGPLSMYCMLLVKHAAKISNRRCRQRCVQVAFRCRHFASWLVKRTRRRSTRRPRMYADEYDNSYFENGGEKNGKLNSCYSFRLCLFLFCFSTERQKRRRRIRRRKRKRKRKKRRGMWETGCDPLSEMDRKFIFKVWCY